jgi:hypothetical protein
VKQWESKLRQMHATICPRLGWSWDVQNTDTMFVMNATCWVRSTYIVFPWHAAHRVHNLVTSSLLFCDGRTVKVHIAVSDLCQTLYTSHLFSTKQLGSYFEKITVGFIVP